MRLMKLAVIVSAIATPFAVAQAGSSYGDKASVNYEKNVAPQNVVEVASDAGQFGTLLTAATEAGLADTLATEGPITVFAPTDAAFAKIPQETLNNLLKPENKAQLQALLKNHVVAGEVMSTDLSDGMEATTLEGTTLIIDLEDGVKVNEATVVQPDIKATNGVIHVVDTVIMVNPS